MPETPPTVPTTPPTMVYPHRGGVILALGIISLTINLLTMVGGAAFPPCCMIGVIPIATAIPAWVMANRDLKLMQMGQMDPAGYSSTGAGRVCGIVSLVITGLGLLVGILLVAFGVVALFGVAAAGGGP